jgi:hypothetical protein
MIEVGRLPTRVGSVAADVCSENVGNLARFRPCARFAGARSLNYVRPEHTLDSGSAVLPLQSPAAERSVKIVLLRLLLRFRATLSRWLEVLPSLLASFVLHGFALLLLGLIVLRFSPPASEAMSVEAVANNAPEGPAEAIDRVDFVDDSHDKTETKLVDDKSDPAGLAPKKLPDLSSVPPIDFQDTSLKAAEKVELTVEPTVKLNGELSGRGVGVRSKIAIKGGGSTESERSVTLGLRWLARHQQADGSWSFHHGADDPGSLEKCTTGATGLAILSFLGAGHTHRSDVRFQGTVDKGLKYLVSQMKRSRDGGDLRGQVVSNEGMYAHAIATLALCEAYGLTQDEKLLEPAQQAVNFIVFAQDPKKGGWRYSPHEPGDTTVTGWQVMALKSARSSGLKVPARTLAAAGRFLDTVQAHGGSRYGYVSSDSTPPMTAIGLLCRMYLGWKQNTPALKRGVQFLSQTGPSLGDIYYDYYATQVLHHWGGPEWKKWNEALRDQLIQSQVMAGDAFGSWKPSGDRGAAAGGRLYQTCLCIMTLEVYYRYLPLYQKETAGQ